MTDSPTPMKQRGNRAGFTLIELLVVISIIAILISITIPIYSMVQDSGNSARSLANLKSIGTGISTYASDNNNLLPVIDSEEPLDWTNVTVTLQEEEIEKLPHWVRAVIHRSADSGADLSTNVFNCPGLRWKNESGEKMASEDILLAYGATDAMAGYDEDGELTPLEARSRATIENGPNTILVIETKQESAMPTSYSYVPWDDAESDFERGTPGESNKIDFRFNKGVNCLMADMSARGYRFKNKGDLEKPHWTGDNYDQLR